ncbi:phosphatase PAP2 family protein [Sulfurimonas sp. SWIR-19]|uniref:phosphatase PAP2 family protein n=1 Tax=Sulfurimonas sp. SWIR-19 TaxID=2878390 RepID=UPI001CF45E76|nr:phosphatase PAP2 family protein [Sulfurimonas sp. SWIR-19]UCN01411.1 phosphatase PAP2 family protein [Sulfurimonas sp. SWIR-19]
MSIVFFGITDVDLSLQDRFFDFTTHKWILFWGEQPYKFIFYDGIKKLLIAFAVSLLLALIFFRKTKLVNDYKRGMIIVILSAIFVPLIASSIKGETNMPCPKDEVRYGGVYPRTAVWQNYTPEFKLHHHKSKCWPAGHASGGFALLSLVFLFHKRRNKIIASAVALTIGWSMGLYKMLIGDHFFSHTVITMVLAWLIILLIAKIVNKIYSL